MSLMIHGQNNVSYAYFSTNNIESMQEIYSKLLTEYCKGNLINVLKVKATVYLIAENADVLGSVIDKVFTNPQLVTTGANPK